MAPSRVGRLSSPALASAAPPRLGRALIFKATKPKKFTYSAAERLAVARYLRAQSHSNILLRWVSKKSDTPRASILLRAIGKARSEPGCLALRGQQPPGGEPGGVGGEAGGSGSGGHDHGIGGGDDDGISTTPLWAAPCAPALLRSGTELGASGAGPGASRARRQHGRRA